MLNLNCFICSYNLTDICLVINKSEIGISAARLKNITFKILLQLNGDKFLLHNNQYLNKNRSILFQFNGFF